jgi:hypothetical protein
MTFESVLIVGAFTTLIGVLLKWESKRNNTFINFVKDTMKQNEEYHTIKNGHLDKVAERFNGTTMLFMEKIEILNDSINRANENNVNNVSVLNDCARALDHYHKDIKK